jgi:hypothetical protein
MVGCALWERVAGVRFSPPRHMNFKKTLHILPRIISIIFLIFISIFAFDEFFGWGFFIHLIPSFILAVIIFLSWKKDKFGAIAFLILGIIFTVFFKTYKELVNFLLLSLPLFILSGLHYWNLKLKKN